MLEVLEVSGLVTFQDSGRRGWRSYGVPVSGAMDGFAHRAANVLVGNPVDFAAVEIGLGEANFLARQNCVIAVTGTGYEVENYAWTFPLWTSFFVRAGWRVKVKKTSGGNWAYLSVSGGFDVAPVLGSRSAYVRGGIGAPIRAGDLLKVGKPSNGLNELAARTFPVEKYISYIQTPVIEVIPGPQAGGFTDDGIKTFYASEYQLTQSFDRMGYRLQGNAIEYATNAELISEGMASGSVQVPASGQPIVMMADAPTTGGYPKIANVVTADLPLLAQCEAGKCRIRFKETTVEEAQEKLRQTSEAFKTSKGSREEA